MVSRRLFRIKEHPGFAVSFPRYASIGYQMQKTGAVQALPTHQASLLPQANKADRILALAYPIVEDDKVTSIAGCITDISTFKWAETVQARSAQAAKDAKKLQENFIDVVSHGI